MTTTLKQLADLTGVSVRTIYSRINNYPLKHLSVMPDKTRVFDEDDLLQWHDKMERITEMPADDLQRCINQGSKARHNGANIIDNPYVYRSQLMEFCAWAAGWHDAK